MDVTEKMPLQRQNKPLQKKSIILPKTPIPAICTVYGWR